MSDAMRLIRETCKREYLRQPAQTLEPFERHREQASWWGNSKQSGLWCYDRNADYLAAMGSVCLGVGEYRHQVEPTSTFGAEKQCGLWHVEIQDWQALIFPSLVRPGWQWLYSPIVTLLAKQGSISVVREAYIWPQSKRVLEPFYQALKARREQGENVKQLYTLAVGLLAHCPQVIWKTCIYRPDWHALIISQAKMLNYYHMRRVYEQEGVWPVAMKVDCLYYDRQVYTLKLGTGIGQYKESRT